MTSLLHLLHNTGLKNMYPLVCRLFSIATTLPISTAEDERVFFTGEIDKDQSQKQHQDKNTEIHVEHQTQL